MQNGFRPMRSSVHAIATVTLYTRIETDKNLTEQTSFIDVKKLFDS